MVRLPVRGRLAVEIQHVLDAVDLLLDRGCDGVGNGLRGSAGILRGDDHRRRHHLRIFRDRQRGVGDRADDQQHDRQHHRQDGLVDGEPAEIHVLLPAGRRAPRCGLTFAPTRARCRPSTITRSSGFRPSRITRRPSSSGPSVTGLASTVLSSLTTKTILRDWSVRDRGVRQQQRLIGRAADQPHAAELPRQDREILVRDHRAAAQRAGRDIQPVVEEIHLAVMRRFGFAGQRHLHRIRRIARTRPLALEPEPVVLEIGRLVHVEIDVDRIERDDRGQQRARRPRCPARDCRR